MCTPVSDTLSTRLHHHLCIAVRMHTSCQHHILLGQYHILLGVQVQDLEKARIFYTEGLGLAMDPGANFRQRGSVFVNFFNCGR